MSQANGRHHVAGSGKYRGQARELRQLRREQADTRRAAREERTDAQQLALLVERGYADCREAKRLREAIKAANS